MLPITRVVAIKDRDPNKFRAYMRKQRRISSFRRMVDAAPQNFWRVTRVIYS